MTTMENGKVYDGGTAEIVRLRVIVEEVSTKVDQLNEKHAELEKDVKRMNSLLDKGWGIVIGAVAVFGFFAAEVIEGFKRMMGLR